MKYALDLGSTQVGSSAASMISTIPEVRCVDKNK